VWILTTLLDAASVCECTQWILSISINWKFTTENYAFRWGLLNHIDTALQSGTPDHVGITAPLGLVYFEGGRWKEAEVLQVPGIETAKQVLGEEHPNTLTSIGNLASTYGNQGRWKGVEVLQVLVMKTTQWVLGEEHPTTLTSMDNLASTYCRQGAGDDSNETSAGWGAPWHTHLHGQSGRHQTQGRWKEAEVLQVLVMETTKQVLGEEHPAILTTMDNMASTYCNQGRWKEAELQVLVMTTSAGWGAPWCSCQPTTLPQSQHVAQGWSTGFKGNKDGIPQIEYHFHSPSTTSHHLWHIHFVLVVPQNLMYGWHKAQQDHFKDYNTAIVTT
jgi:putative hemolysin